eukprot:gene7538-13321_t
MGGAVSAGQDNDELVTNLCEANYIKSREVERVFRLVDRGDFFPGDYPEDAYKDLAWKQGNVHISAPCIYCEVMEAFELQEGLSFLNLGSGTGYLSTLVGLMIGPYGLNHGVELYKDVIEYSYSKVVNFLKHAKGLNPASFAMPNFVVGNCLMINPSYRKYDRVYCGAGCPLEHEAYLKSLIKVGGILIVPIRDTLMKYKRISATDWEESNLLPVQFAPLIEPEKTDIADSIIEITAEPYSLQEICRFSILQNIRGNTSKSIRQLPLPTSLLGYLDFYREPQEKKRRVERKGKDPFVMHIVVKR